jgi:sporulation protein YlmC with PRC-barrel domain
VTSLRAAIGKPVIDRESAEQVGEVRCFSIDAAGHRVIALVVAQGRSTSIVDWTEIQSVGPDAVIVKTSRDPTSDEERLVSGALDPLNKRVLSDLGNELGQVADAEVDDAGLIQTLAVADQQVAGARLRGVGSYAVVIAADLGEA